jgi:hypothetical protein
MNLYWTASVETAVADADAVAHAERASELAVIIPMTRCFMRFILRKLSIQKENDLASSSLTPTARCRHSRDDRDQIPSSSGL